MASKKEKNQFESFIEAFKKAHPSLEKKDAQKKAIKQWNEVKNVLKENPNSNVISDKMQEFKLKQSQQNSQKLLFWQNFRKSGASSTKAEEEISQQSIPKVIAAASRESNNIER